MIPSGQITFLFTDIEGSTRLWEKDPEMMRRSLERHNTILSQAIEAEDGYVFKTMGDEVCAAFAEAYRALRSALEIQKLLANEPWPGDSPIRVRMGLHTGHAEVSAGDYMGPPLNHVARLMSAGHGGQILVSSATYETLVRQGHIPQRCLEIGDDGGAYAPPSSPISRFSFDGISLVDLGEHRLKDLGRTEHIYQVQSPDQPAQFPPLRASQTFLNNLPVLLTSFIGREKELADVKRLLAEHRLLTLTGPGGTGKTRLAMQAAVDLLDIYADGVWLVELAPVADPVLIPRALAFVLGVHEDPARSLPESLTDYLRPRQVLVLLDNCEHVIDACAALIETLLQACPRLTILATSRETLGLSGETPYRVPSFASPDLHNLPPVKRLIGYPSVRLFIERARTFVPDFALDDENAAAVAQICSRLDGIPLAIELAAARVKFMQVTQIAARLDDRFRLLTGGSRTALPRQQTLEALIDWSWDMLPEKERILLGRLSAFAGGWQLEAAEYVCSDPTGWLENWEILDLLTNLANKSLVMTEYRHAQEPRYRLLETIRQYARERLVRTGDGKMIHDRHADWYLQWAETGENNFKSPRIVRWMDRLEMEHDNLRSALEWLISGKADVEKGLRLAGAMGQFWQVRGYYDEGNTWLGKTLESTPSDPGPDPDKLMYRARALTWFGHATMIKPNPEQNHVYLEQAIALLRRAGAEQRLRLAEALWLLVQTIGSEQEKAREAIAESVEIARQAGPSAIWYLANALSRYSFFPPGDMPIGKAIEVAEETQKLNEQAGDRWNVGPFVALSRLSEIQGNVDKALAYCQEALIRSAEAGDKENLNYFISRISNLERVSGHTAEAYSHYWETAQNWVELNNLGGTARCLECMAFLAIDHGQIEKAAALFGKASSLRQESGRQMEGDESQEYARYLKDLQSRMSMEQLAAAWNAGARHSLQNLFQAMGSLDPKS